MEEMSMNLIRFIFLDLNFFTHGNALISFVKRHGQVEVIQTK
jgi:hypothetical protein